MWVYKCDVCGKEAACCNNFKNFGHVCNSCKSAVIKAQGRIDNCKRRLYELMEDYQEAIVAELRTPELRKKRWFFF